MKRRRAAALLAAGWLPAARVAADGDGDRALAPWARPPAAAQRTGPGDPLEWERRFRNAERAGPRAVRPEDRALLAALREGRFDEALRSVKAGRGAVDARDDSGGLPIVLAAAAGQDTLVRELLQHGATVDAIGEGGHSALTAAAWHGWRSTVRLLLRSGADASRLATNGHGALHLAAIAGHGSVLDELLRGGVPIELLNRQRESALDVAAAAGRDDMLEQLLAAGADANNAGRR
jgi:ankyrin repeat protein